MSANEVSPKDAVIALMEGAVPERVPELHALWKQYNPDVVLMMDAKRVILNANRNRIAFDAKTKDVFWMIGFAGWKAIECYSPLVVVSAGTGQIVSDVITYDHNLPEFERAYKERRAAAQALQGRRLNNWRGAISGRRGRNLDRRIYLLVSTFLLFFVFLDIAAPIVSEIRLPAVFTGSLARCA